MCATVEHFETLVFDGSALHFEKLYSNIDPLRL